MARVIVDHWVHACHAHPLQICQAVLGSAVHKIEDGFTVLADLSCPATVLRPEMWHDPTLQYELCAHAIKKDASAISCILSENIHVDPKKTHVFDRLKAFAANQMYVGNLTTCAMKAQRFDLQVSVSLGHRVLRLAFGTYEHADDELAVVVNEPWHINTRTSFWPLLQNVIWRAQIPYVAELGKDGPIVLDFLVRVRILERDKTLLVYLLLFADVGLDLWTTSTMPAGFPLRIWLFVQKTKRLMNKRNHTSSA